MAWFKFKQIDKDESGNPFASFEQVHYAEGILQPISPQTFKMKVENPIPDFGASAFYEIYSDDKGGENYLSPYGWKAVEPEDILRAETNRITTDLEKGRIPIGLNDEQEEKNKKALQALDDFVRRKKSR